MIRSFLLFVITLGTLYTSAQCQYIEVSDTFSDNDFTSNPRWEGDSTCFIISDGVLRLNGTKADSSYLTTKLELPYSDTLEWSFFLKHNSLTSNNSVFRFYLITNSINPSLASEALYIQIRPRTLSKMEFCLLQNNTIDTLMKCNYRKNSLSAGQLRVRILRFPNNEWTIECDTNGTENYTPLWQNSQPIIFPNNGNGFISLWCKYTSNDKNKFFVDDIKGKISSSEPYQNTGDTIQPNDIIINETLFNPYSGGSDFVELYNRTNKPIALKNLFLATWNESSQTIKTKTNIPTELAIQPKDYIVITTDTTFLKSHYTVKNPKQMIQIKSMPTYSNAKGSVIVTLNDSTIIDIFHYSESYHYTWLSDVKGVSLERRSADWATQDSTNWHSAAKSANWATPTYQNSQAYNIIVPEEAFKVEPNTFSPDNDGYNDILNIYYNSSSDNLLCNIYIFDSKGIIVKALEHNALLGSENYFTWNGSNDNGAMCPIGHYIVYIEVFDTKGNIQQMKKLIALML